MRRGTSEEPTTTAAAPPVRLCWGDVVVPVVPAALTAGAFACVRVTADDAVRRPAYVDHAADEVLHAVSGTFAVTVGDADPVLLEAGGVVFVPRGQPRRFDVVGGGGTLQVMATPGDSLDELLALLARTPAPDARALARCGIEVLAG